MTHWYPSTEVERHLISLTIREGGSQSLLNLLTCTSRFVSCIMYHELVFIGDNDDDDDVVRDSHRVGVGEPLVTGLSKDNVHGH